jgi:hypothetical protein
VTIPDDVRQQFREEYLVRGIASHAAKAVGIATSTGSKFAGECWKDPEFVRTWHELRAIDLPELRNIVVETARSISARIQEPDKTPEELAQIAVDAGLKSFSYQNPKPQYFRGLVGAYDTLSKPREATGELRDTGPAVVINMPPDSEPEAPDGAPV